MIYVEVNHNDLEYVRSRLKHHEEEAPKALRDAINDTATHARSLLSDAARSQYTVKKGGFNNHAKIKKATVSHLVAEIRVNGRPLTLTRFHTTAPKSGAKAEVVQGNGLKLLDKSGIKAFSGKGKSGMNNLILQRKGKARLPLKSFYGNSVPKMIEKVYTGRSASAGLKDQIEQNYQHNVDRQIARVMSG